jgi:hypothetical protein
VVSLGIAKGAIQIGLDQLQRQRQVVINSARQMGTAFEKSFQGASRAVLSFDKSLASLNGRIKSINGELTALSIGGAALSGFGLQAADNVANLQARFRSLAKGDMVKANALMEQIATRAGELGLPIRQAQQAFAGFIPIIEQTGGSLDNYISLAARLTTLNPAEGLEGAIFAIRELVTSGGTDTLSLTERFNLPRKALKELIAETGNFEIALDQTLDTMGATEELAAQLSGNLATTSSRFIEAGRDALARGFNPYLETTINLLQGVTDVIANVPDGFLQIGAGATIAVTGIAAMTLATSQLITTYQNLQKAGFFTNFASVGAGIAKAGVLAGAAALGTGAGILGVQTFGDATGNERLSNFGLKEAGETLKQAIFLIINTMIDGARAIALMFNGIVEKIQEIPNAFTRFRGNLEIAFGGVLTVLGNFVASLPGGSAQGLAFSTIGENLRTAGEQRVQDASGRRLGSLGSFESESPTDQINARFDEFQLAAARMFGFIEAEAEATTDAIETTVDEGLSALEIFKAAREADNAEFLASLQERISFEQEYAELLREGSPEQIQDRLQALADEKAAIEQFLPELREVAKTSEEGAAQLAEYETRLAAIDEQTTRFGDAMITASTKAIKMLDTDFQAEVAKIEAEREKAIGEALADLQKGLTELDADVLSKSKELRAENVEALQEYQDAERDIIAKHREKVLEIERKSREDITDAAARLDAAGVFSAQKRREEQLTEANKGLNEERAKNAEKLAETQRNLAQEALQLQAYYVERRNALLIENQTELAQLNAKFNAEISTAQTAYQTERNQLNQHLQTQLAARAAAQARENSLLSQGLQTAQNLFGRFVNGIASQLSGMQGASKSIGSQVASYRPASASPVLSYATNGMTFATGGVASFAGSGSAMAMVENKERILTPQQNANFERLITAISNPQATASGNTLPSNLSVDVTGVDSFEALVERVARSWYGKMLEGRTA